MSSEVLGTLIGLLGVAGGLITALLAVNRLRHEKAKLAAETKQIENRATSEEVDTVVKLTDLVNTLQTRNAELYDQNIALEKAVTEKDKTIEILTARLNEREGQLNNANRQIEHFQKLAKDAPIIETLREQLSAMNIISGEFQKAQEATLLLLREKEKSYTELMKITNRDLSMPKVPRE